MCSPSPDQGTIQILTVDDPFVGPPAATWLTVQEVDYDDGGADGAVSDLAEGPASQGTINLGTYDETVTGSLLVTATDQERTTVAWGETLPIQFGAVAGLTLGVFVQRPGMLSRMPSPLGDGRPPPLLGIVGGRYILVAGGGDPTLGTQTRLYDLISWAPLSSPPTLPFAPESIAIAQATEGDFQLLAINSSGAIWYDLTEADTDDAGAPSGGTGSWADVAGGITITSSDLSTQYVVGGTRTSGAPTTTVLVVANGGNLSWANFGVPRLGATAAYVDPIGLVIEGGNVASPDGGANPGAEYLVTNTTGVGLGYPADTTTRAGMAMLGAPGAVSSSVLLVGGASETSNGAVGGDTVRVLTVPCGGSSDPPCTTTLWPVTLPTPLVSTQVFDIDASNVFVVGQDANQVTHAYTLSYSAPATADAAAGATVTEIPFRVPRSLAQAIALPYGTPGITPIAVVGGDPDAGANTGYIESFVPAIASFVP